MLPGFNPSALHASSGGVSPITVFLKSGTTSYTVPAGYTSAYAHAIGPGGWGLSYVSNGGGGGGAYAGEALTLTPGEVLTVVIDTPTQGSGTIPLVQLKRGSTILLQAEGAYFVTGTFTSQGGRASNSIGTVKYSGGQGGGGQNESGGSGAAGPQGAGAAGGTALMRLNNSLGIYEYLGGGGGGANGGSAGGNAAGTTPGAGGAKRSGAVSGAGGRGAQVYDSPPAVVGEMEVLWIQTSNGETAGPGGGGGGGARIYDFNTSPATYYGYATSRSSLGYGGGAGNWSQSNIAGGPGIIVLELS